MKFQVSIVIITIIVSSCKKFVDVGPPALQLSSETVFQSDATATAAQLAIYSQLEGSGFVYNSQLICGALSADEFKNYQTSVTVSDLANGNLTSDNSMVLSMWNGYYKYIYQANAVLSGVAASKTLSQAVRNQLEGEAKFIRAWCHFYLVNFFGPVPIIKETNYLKTSTTPRSTDDSVYTFIIQDLQDAINLLDAEYRSPSNAVSLERLRPNKGAARAMMARVSLYKSDWLAAEAFATAVIEDNRYALVTDMNNVFLKNSTEAIWQLQPVLAKAPYIGLFLPFTGTPFSSSLEPELINAFATNDGRKDAWTKASSPANLYYYGSKYKTGFSAVVITEYTMLLRLAEVYLIRAEARARLGNLAESQADLNLLRLRAGLDALSGLEREDLIDSIQTERRLELFAEIPDRWINLKRTGKALSTLQPFKGSSYSVNDLLYPIPLQELLRNPNLTQNPGY